MSKSAFRPIGFSAGVSSASVKKAIGAILAVLLLASVTVLSDGCAANKCDCPRFSGHRLGH